VIIMDKGLRLTHATLKVLRVFMNGSTRGIAGSDIWKETGMLSGSLYPILARLEKAGWLESWWEDIDPKEAGRPRKRLYRLTGAGQREAMAAFSEIMPLEGQLAWSF
jgi:DNA-binding PadR family transcriptional regulator